AAPTPATYTLSLHDALPISRAYREGRARPGDRRRDRRGVRLLHEIAARPGGRGCGARRDPRALGEALRPRAVALVASMVAAHSRSEEHTSELQSRFDLVCRL